MKAIAKSFGVVSLLTELTDEELVLEYRKSNESRYFEELVNRYRPGLTRFLKMRYNLRNDQVEDAVQATFARIWQKLGQYDTGRALRPWIFRIASTQTIDILREMKRRCDVISLDAPISSEDDKTCWAAEIAGREPEPSAELDRIDTAIEVRCALAKLPHVFRQVLELVFFQGLTRQSVADALHLTVSTVSRRVTRALEQLKIQLLKGQYGLRRERMLLLLQGLESY